MNTSIFSFQLTAVAIVKAFLLGEKIVITKESSETGELTEHLILDVLKKDPNDNDKLFFKGRRKYSGNPTIGASSEVFTYSGSLNITTKTGEITTEEFLSYSDLTEKIATN